MWMTVPIRFRSESLTSIPQAAASPAAILCFTDRTGPRRKNRFPYKKIDNRSCAALKTAGTKKLRSIGVFRFGEKGATRGVILLAITLMLAAGLAAIARKPAPVNRDGHFAPRASSYRITPSSGVSIPSPVDAPFTFHNTGSLNTARYYHTATLLPNGMVLVAGGFDSNGNPSASSELFDPASGTWTATTGNLNTARYLHTASLLPNGMVLVAGGSDGNGDPCTSEEIIDPGSRSSTTTNSNNNTRYHTKATTLHPSERV